MILVKEEFNLDKFKTRIEKKVIKAAGRRKKIIRDGKKTLWIFRGLRRGDPSVVRARFPV